MEQKFSKVTQEKIAELQMMQQRLSLFSGQKQQFQIQMAEVENALAEIGNAKPPVYKMVGEIMIEKNLDELKNELQEKKVELDIRIKSLEKQESRAKEQALALQKEISAELK